METGVGNPSHLTFTLGSTMDASRTMGPLVVAPADSAPAVGGAVVDTAFWPPSSSRAVSASPPPEDDHRHAVDARRVGVGVQATLTIDGVHVLKVARLGRLEVAASSGTEVPRRWACGKTVCGVGEGSKQRSARTRS